MLALSRPPPRPLFVSMLCHSRPTRGFFLQAEGAAEAALAAAAAAVASSAGLAQAPRPALSDVMQWMAEGGVPPAG